MAARFHKCNPTGTASACAPALEEAMQKMATFQRISWRDALGSVAGAAGRMHRYRGLRTRLLDRALNCGRDATLLPGKHDDE